MMPDKKSLAERLEAEALTWDARQREAVQMHEWSQRQQNYSLENIWRNNAADAAIHAADLRAAAEAVRASQWRPWPSMDDESEYPPDETDVIIYCGNWVLREIVIGRVSRRRGVYGPSGASHWRPIPAPPEVEG